MEEFSHIDRNGKAIMVDISSKPVVLRKAVAEGFIRLNTNTVGLIRENSLKKGDVLTLAEVSGIQAAKKTGELIPLCHPLMLTNVEVKTRLEEEGVRIRSTVTCTGKTGVEMEALTAVSVALLTIYDMCKAVDKNMMLEKVFLVEKTKSDIYE